MNLDLLCERYCASNPRIRSAETKRLLILAVRQYSAWLENHAKLGDLSHENLMAFRRWRECNGRAESTIERETCKLLTLWRFAADEGLVTPPKLRVSKARVETPVCFLRGELHSLFRAARHYKHTIGGVPGDVFWCALLGTIWDTAERIGAVRQIARADFALPGGWWPGQAWVTIRRRKGHGKTLVRPLRASTARHLRQFLAATPSEYPFAIVDRTSLYAHLNRVLKSAGLPQDRQHKFHCLRRSHASYLAVAGGDASASLGHADPKIVRERYFDPRVTEKQQPIDLLFAPESWWHRITRAFRP